MKLLFDLLPIPLFVVCLQVAEGQRSGALAWAGTPFEGLVDGGRMGVAEAPVLLATLVVVLATAAQMAWTTWRGRKVETLLWVSLALVVVLGGVTLWSLNDTHIKWKPSVLYWATGVAFWLSPILFNRNLPKALLGEHFDPPAWVWLRLNLFWIGFLSGMGLLNLWIADSFSRETWMAFTLFGGIGLVLAFTLAQAALLGRYAPARQTAAGHAAGAAERSAAAEGEGLR